MYKYFHFICRIFEEDYTEFHFKNLFGIIEQQQIILKTRESVLKLGLCELFCNSLKSSI